MKLRNIIGAVLAAFIAVLAVSASASASPAVHHRPALCARTGRGPCLTVADWRHKSELVTGRGSRVKVVSAGRVTARWPFSHTPSLNRTMRGLPLVQLRAGRWCVGGTGNGTVRLLKCSALTEWVRGFFGPHVWTSVRASDAAGLPSVLSAGAGRAAAETLNGYQIGMQEWAR